MLKSETTLLQDCAAVNAPTKVRTMNLGDAPIKRLVTTSWDDGDPDDLRIAIMLAARKLPGTFYVPVKGHHKTSRMTHGQMLDLDSQGFEIGAHGIAHSNLPECDDKQLFIEVDGSKKQMEDDLGKRVFMFAYPRGRHNTKVIAAMKRAGFSGARTTAMLARSMSFDPYRMPTTSHVFPHSRVRYFRNLARAWDPRRAWAYATHIRCAGNWVDLAKVLFDSVLERGGLWHLYGHSWEIEELQLWDELAEILDYVANRPGVQYVSNYTALQMRTQRVTDGANCTELTTL